MKKIPEKKKVFLFIASAVVVALFAIIYSVNTYYKQKRFFNSEIHSNVISSINWKLRSIDFYLKDNSQIEVFVRDTDKIKIGDSIFKPSKTFFYEVYRKNKNNEYELNKINEY